ncbi:MAG: hypothetical protein QM669_00895 [Siphonobacter sp.]
MATLTELNTYGADSIGYLGVFETRLYLFKGRCRFILPGKMENPFKYLVTEPAGCLILDNFSADVILFDCI